MTTYNTGNPVGSSDPKDLYDNAENFDVAVNNRTADFWTDRRGVQRQTWAGIERSGGIQGFATLDDLQASQGQSEGQLAYVTNDEQNNGMYRWSGSSWILSDIHHDYVNINNDDFVQLANSIDEIDWSANYFINDGSVTSPVERGFPIRGLGGFLTVKRNRSNAVVQEWVTYFGSAYRWGNRSGETTTWTPWIGARYGSDISLQNGQLGTKNLNNIFEPGVQIQTSLNQAYLDRGYPVSRGGLLTSVGSTEQNAYKFRTYETINGLYTQQYLSASQWGDWVRYPTESDVSREITEKLDAAVRHLVIYGSSTLWYLSDRFEQMAASHGFVLKNHAISGDNIGGAGQAIGANVVEIEFPSGQINSGSNPVVVTSTFGTVARHNRSVRLSNGRSGTLSADATSFTPTGGSLPDLGLNGIKLTVSETAWTDKDFRGIYIINIGKNDVSSIDNSDYIVDRTADIIDYIPEHSKFVVLGHFSNVNSSNAIRDTIDAINQKLKSKYGDNYLDVNELLFSQKTFDKLGIAKTDDDISNINERKLPPSLSRDNGHLSPAMGDVLFEAIYNKLNALGYVYDYSEMERKIKQQQDDLLRLKYGSGPYPSLDLDFIGASHDVVNDQIDFSRASSATYFNQDGLLFTADADEPRINYDPENGECLGLLIERQSTNLLLWSGDFSASVWSDIENGKIVDQLDSRGGYNAVTFLGGTGEIAVIGQITTTSKSGQHTATIVVKPVEGKSPSVDFLLRNNTTTTNFETFKVNLSDGTTPSTNVTITPQPNGFWKITWTTREEETITAGDNLRIYVGSTSNFGNKTNFGITVDYAQLEEGTRSTSYIPTEGSQVTRAADLAYVNNLEGIINRDAGTLFMQYTPIGPIGASPNVFAMGLSDGTNMNRISFGESTIGSSPFGNFFWITDGVTGSSAANTYPSAEWGKQIKAALSWQGQNYTLVADGVILTKGTSSTVFPEVKRLALGSVGYAGGSRNMISQHSRALLYKRALTDTELMEITE